MDEAGHDARALVEQIRLQAAATELGDAHPEMNALLAR